MKKITSASLTFEQMLTGGHPNSLGRTEEVVAIVEAEPAQMDALFGCFGSADALVRLRTASAFKRLIRAQPSRFLSYIERMVVEVGPIDQAGTQWTISQIIGENLAQWQQMPQAFQAQSLDWMFELFERTKDWIVLNLTMKTLTNIGVNDASVDARLRPHIETCLADKRRSVANTARKALKALDSGKAIK